MASLLYIYDVIGHSVLIVAIAANKLRLSLHYRTYIVHCFVVICVVHKVKVSNRGRLPTLYTWWEQELPWLKFHGFHRIVGESNQADSTGQEPVRAECRYNAVQTELLSTVYCLVCKYRICAYSVSIERRIIWTMVGCDCNYVIILIFFDPVEVGRHSGEDGVSMTFVSCWSNAYLRVVGEVPVCLCQRSSTVTYTNASMTCKLKNQNMEETSKSTSRPFYLYGHIKLQSTTRKFVT